MAKSMRERKQPMTRQEQSERLILEAKETGWLHVTKYLVGEDYEGGMVEYFRSYQKSISKPVVVVIDAANHNYSRIKFFRAYKTHVLTNGEKRDIVDLITNQAPGAHLEILGDAGGEFSKIPNHLAPRLAPELLSYLKLRPRFKVTPTRRSR